MTEIKKFAEDNGANIITDNKNQLIFKLTKNLRDLKLSGRYKITVKNENHGLHVEIVFLSELFFYYFFLVFSSFILLSIVHNKGISADHLGLLALAVLSGHLMRPFPKIVSWKTILTNIGLKIKSL